MINQMLVYVAPTANAWKATLRYRTSVFLWMMTDVVWVIIMYWLWRAVFASATTLTLGGFTFQQMVSYLLLSTFISKLAAGSLTGFFAGRLLSGSIIIDLLRPVDMQLYVFAENVGARVNAFVNALPAVLMMAVGLRLGLPASAEALFLFMATVALSFVLYFLIDYIVSCLAFFTTDEFGLHMAKRIVVQFLAGGFIPVTFFPAWLQRTNDWLPFQSLVNTPIRVYLGQLTGPEAWRAIAIQSLWIVLLFSFSRSFYRVAVQRVTIYGG